MIKILLILLLLFSCKTVGATDAKAETQPEPVTLQLKWKHQFQFAGYYAAKEKGFFKEEGLDVTLLEATPNLDTVQEVVSERAQFGVGTSELVLSRHRGVPIVVLGVIFQHSPLVLITLTESGIDHIHKLVDRKVMIEPQSAELFAYLYQEGFTRKAIDLQHHSFDIDDLLNGKTDAMSIYVTDELYTLKQKNRSYNQFSPRMSGIDFYGDNFFTTEKELKEHPQRVEAFRRAALRGWRYAMQNPDEIIQLIYQRYPQRHSIEHLQFEAQAMYDLMQPELIEPGYMNIGRWQTIANSYQQLGLLPQNFDVKPMLYFPDTAIDLKKLKQQLYYILGGLFVLTIILLTVFRFYRLARTNEARLNTMFDHAPLSLIVLDEKNQICHWNAQAEKTFLWRAGEMLGKNILSIVNQENHEKLKEIFLSVHKEQKILYSENTNFKKDGNAILCEWINAPFKDQHNQSSYIICMARDITEQRQLEQQLERAAHYDSLTALPNRILILNLLKQALALAARQQTKLALLFLDLNCFKAINDTLGHEAGDILLQMIAQRLPLAIRQSDYVGRLAGDEFLIILQDIDSPDHIQRTINKLNELISQPCYIKNQSLSISASIGTSFYPDDATEINQLIAKADKNMYQVKNMSHSKTA